MAGLSVRQSWKKRKREKLGKETTTTTRFPFGIAVEYFLVVFFCVRVKLFGNKILTQQLLALADLGWNT
jgi:hypothetical protein